MANFCGGLKLNPDTFKIENGVITLANNDETITDVTTLCGQLFDGGIFETARLDGKHYILTAVGVDLDIPVGTPIKSNCGFYVDPRFFTVTNGVLDYTDRHLLEVLVSPEDVDYTITVALSTSPGESIDPLGDLGNVYPLDEIDEKYTITVNATGYTEYTNEITADKDYVLEVTLTPSSN